MKNRSVAALREDFEEEKTAQMHCYNEKLGKSIGMILAYPILYQQKGPTINKNQP